MHNNVSILSAKQHLVIDLLLAISFLTFFIVPSAVVFAQGTTPPVDPNSAWGEVMNPDGSINYDNLTDGGVVTQSTDWMPSIPLVGPVDAEYHVYYTPSGNTVLMPTASTLFFMASNPNESGFNAAASTLGTSGLSVADGTNTFTGIAGLGTMLASMTGNGPDATLTLPSGEQILSSDFFQQVVSGQQDIFALGPTGLTNFLSSLISQTSSDLQSGNGLNLYTYMLLYPPAQCGSVPGGCTPEQLALLQTLIPPTEEPTPPPANDCPAPEVIPGEIIKNGTKVAPNYPLVVGQDPDKRGVDISVDVHVEPTIVKSWTPEVETECQAGPNANGVTNCTTKNGQKGHEKIVGWTCEEHQQVYQECINFASTEINLTNDSRDWILNELSIRYPNAYIHKPRISMGSSHNCSWTQTFPKLQTADPGYWDILISGQTAGTPVSAPRTFGGAVGQFGVWLKEIAIIK
jgi:hypothetical protein